MQRPLALHAPVWALVLTLGSSVGPLAAGDLDVEAAPAREILRRTPFTATDDFWFSPALLTNPDLLQKLLSAVECPGHEPTGDPLTPCPPGSAVEVRGFPYVSVIEGSDPRFSGREIGVANANLDADYAGRVWGLWTLRLASGGGSWRGIWYGSRSFIPEGGGRGVDTWLSELHLSGFGAGPLAGLRVRATESVVTYTPLPFPYEALEPLQVPGPCSNGECPPEGMVEGRILEPLRR